MTKNVQKIQSFLKSKLGIQIQGVRKIAPRKIAPRSGSGFGLGFFVRIRAGGIFPWGQLS